MSNVGLSIKLSPAEQTRLRQWECAHGTPQQVALRCRIILGALASEDNVAIAEELEVSLATVRLWRKRVHQRGTKIPSPSSGRQRLRTSSKRSPGSNQARADQARLPIAHTSTQHLAVGDCASPFSSVRWPSDKDQLQTGARLLFLASLNNCPSRRSSDMARESPRPRGTRMARRK